MKSSTLFRLTPTATFAFVVGCANVLGIEDLSPRPSADSSVESDGAIEADSSDTSNLDGPVCTPKLVGCNNSVTTFRCSDDGTSVSHETCGLPTPTCSAGACVGVADLARGPALGFTCVRMTDKTVRCWGHNDSGQLGTGNTIDATVPHTVLALTDVSELAIGGYHACALIGGAVRCWGKNDVGQLGLGTTTSFESSPKEVSGLTDALHIAAGVEHTCAVRSTGSVVCWGLNSDGQLGDGTTNSNNAPTPTVTLASTVSRLSLEHTVSCALFDTGSVSCWGGASGTKHGPTAISGFDSVDSIGSGEFHACVHRSDDDTIRCTGSDSLGQLGDDSSTDTTFSASVTAKGTGLGAVGGGGWRHTCGLATTGEVWCWGQSVVLGNGSTGSGGTPHPVKVTGIATAKEVAAHWGHSCALLTDGSLKCWGSNANGECGDQSPTAIRSTPVDVKW